MSLLHDDASAWVGRGEDLIADEDSELQLRRAWVPRHPLAECTEGPPAEPVHWVATAHGHTIEVTARRWWTARRKAAVRLGVDEQGLVPVRKQ